MATQTTLSAIMENLVTDRNEVMLETADGSMFIVGEVVETSDQAMLLKNVIHFVFMPKDGHAGGMQMVPQPVKRTLELVPLAGFLVQNANEDCPRIHNAREGYRVLVQKFYSVLDLSACSGAGVNIITR